MNKEELLSHLQEIAEKEGIMLNPDEKVLNSLLDALMRNKELKGEFYCPCRIPTGDKEEDKKIICPCIYHKEEVERDGHCHCFLFFRKE